MKRRRRETRSENTRAELDQVQRQLDELERRADRAVDQVVEHGRRNRFADRWRRTLPNPRGA